MFEGKNIHYSQSDQKPLCSCSTKICRQRRLTGFGFCIRHILEDPTAPFQFCSHQSLPGQNKCSNIIAKTQPQRLCNTHLVAAGFPAKRERRSLKLLKAMSSSMNDPSQDSEYQTNGGDRSQTSPVCADFETLRFLSDTKRIANCQASSLNGGSSFNGVQHSRVKLEPLSAHPGTTKSPVSKKWVAKTTKPLPGDTRSGQTALKDKSPTEILLKTDPVAMTGPMNAVNGLVKHSWGLSAVSTTKANQEEQKRVPGSQLATFKTAPVPSNISVSLNTLKNPSQTTDGSQQLITSRKRKLSLKAKNGTGAKKAKPTSATNLLPALTKVQDLLQNSVYKPLVPSILSEFSSEPTTLDLLKSSRSPRLLSSINLAHFSCTAYEANETKCRQERLAELKADMRRRYLQYAQTIPKKPRRARACREKDASPLEKRLPNWQAEMLPLSPRELRKAVSLQLVQAAKKWPFQTALFLQGRHPDLESQITNKSKTTMLLKRLCCFKVNDGNHPYCNQPALPCANLCMRHILYSVDQQLFEFCATSPPCATPVIATSSSGLPLCKEHAHQAEIVNNKSPRRRSRSLTSRRSKKSRRSRAKTSTSGGRGSSCSGESLRNSQRTRESSENLDLDVETVDSPDLASPAQPTPAQLGPHVRDLNDAVEMASDEMVGLDAAELAREASRILEEHDLNEVLDKLPEEAFQELFSNGRGTFYGQIHSREETEEFERALAAVDKEVTIDHLPHAAPGVEESDLVDLNLLDDPALALGLSHDLVLGTEPVTTDAAFYDASELNHLNLEVDNALPSILEPLNSYEGQKKTTPVLQTSGRRKESPSSGEQYNCTAPSPACGSSPPSTLENQCEPTLAGLGEKTSLNVSSVRNR